MSRKKPGPREQIERSSDNDKRRLRNPIPDHAYLQKLADRAIYEGYSKHKIHPHAFGLDTFSGSREDATYCDGHAEFSVADMSRIPTLLKRGIMAGLVGENSKTEEPSIIWTVDDNGWIYEGRLTTAGQALYHGYPVRKNEAIARDVLVRYMQYVYDNPSLGLQMSSQRLQARYS